jgi:hypothetical protein
MAALDNTRKPTHPSSADVSFGRVHFESTGLLFRLSHHVAGKLGCSGSHFDTRDRNQYRSGETYSKTKLRGLSPRAKYADRATAACR